MNKDHILYGIIGLLVGVLIGYVVTDHINGLPPASPGITSNAGQMSGAAAGENLPAGHPETAASSSPASGGNAQAPAMENISKARQDASNFLAQLEAAQLFYQINRFDGATEFIDRAVQIAAKAKPGDFALLKELGDKAFFTNRYSDAEKLYQLALKLRPNDADVRSDLGTCYYNLQPRELDKAIETWRAAIKANPRQEISLQNLTAALIEKGDKAAGRESLKQLEQVNPNNSALAELRSKLNAP